MAKKKTETEPTFENLDMDNIIGEVCSGLKLPPTNLQRGSLLKDALSTGSLAVDLILGGGVPPGMVTIPFGKEQGGKSTLLYSICKSAVDSEIYTMFFDWEGATDADRIDRMGLKIDWAKEVEAGEPVYFRYYNTMKNGEQMFRTIKRILDKLPDKNEGPPQMVFFLDSMPAVVPEAVDENDENAQASRRAAMFADELPNVKSRANAKRCNIVMTNQLRENPRARFGNPEYEPCGNAPKYYSDARIKMRPTVSPIGTSKSYVAEEPGFGGEGEDRYTFISVKTTKNKTFSPNREAVLRLWFEENGKPGRGIDPVWDLFEYLRLTGQVRRGRRKVKSTKESCLIFDSNFYDDLLLWQEFKDMVLNPTEGNTDLVRKAREQIASKEAFDLYFQKLSGVSNEEHEDDEEVVE